MVRVKPTDAGLVVLDELGRRIPKEGIDVRMSPFIKRLIKERALRIVQLPSKEGAK